MSQTTESDTNAKKGKKSSIPWEMLPKDLTDNLQKHLFKCAYTRKGYSSYTVVMGSGSTTHLRSIKNYKVSRIVGKSDRVKIHFRKVR